MKFESKFGIGEIVIYEPKRKNGGHVWSDALEVQGIYFGFDGAIEYVCRYPNGVTVGFKESQLIGDPDFDQESGYKEQATTEHKEGAE